MFTHQLQWKYFLVVHGALETKKLYKTEMLQNWPVGSQYTLYLSSIPNIMLVNIQNVKIYIFWTKKKLVGMGPVGGARWAYLAHGLI